MATFSGHGGSLTFSGITVELISWNISGDADVTDSTTQGSTYRTRLTGLKNWTASAELLTPKAGIGTDAVSTTQTLTIDTGGGITYAGSALCSSISVTQGLEGISTSSVQFEGTNTLGQT